MLIRITVPNFREHNPRSDLKTMQWIRLDVRTPKGKKLHGARTSAKWAWVCILCQLGDENKMDGSMECDTEWLADDVIKENHETVLEDLKWLSTKGLLEMTQVGHERIRTNPIEPVRDPDESDRLRALHNERDERDERTNETEYVGLLPKTDTPGPQVSELVSIWNELRAGAMPLVRKAVKPGTQRYKAAAARLKDEPSLEYWRDIMRRIAQSAFCRGEVKEWRADFDFFTRQETHIKVLEGKYDQQGPMLRRPPQSEILVPLDRPRSY